MKIVESSINDVYNRHQHVEKQKQMIRQIDHSSVDLNTSKEEYRKNVTAKRQKNKVASLFKDLL
jgi:hypothetical protein